MPKRRTHQQRRVVRPATDDDQGRVVSLRCNPSSPELQRIHTIRRLVDTPFDRVTFKLMAYYPSGNLPLLHLAAFRNDVILMAEVLPVYRMFGKVNHLCCGYTAMDLALRNNRTEAVSFLLAQDDVSVRLATSSYQQIPALFNAICFSTLELVELTLNDTRVDVDARCPKNLSALLYASKVGRTDCVEFLLRMFPEKSRKPIESCNGMTPSFFACYHGYIPMIDVLKQHDCFDALRTDHADRTGLHFQYNSIVIQNANGELVYPSAIATAFKQGQRNTLKKVLPELADEDIIETLKSVIGTSDDLSMSLPIALKHVTELHNYIKDLLGMWHEAVRCRKTSAVHILAEALKDHVCASWRRELVICLHQARRVVGGGDMMRSLYKLWREAWQLHASVKIYELSLRESSATADEAYDELRSELYDELRHIHSYDLTSDKCIDNEMLLVSTRNGFTCILQLIVDAMLKKNLPVDSSTFTSVFPEIGTSLLNLSVKHEEKFDWLVKRFDIQTEYKSRAEAFRTWYEYLEQFDQRIPKNLTHLSIFNMEYLSYSTEKIQCISRRFLIEEQHNNRVSVFSAIQAFMKRFGEVIAKKDIIPESTRHNRHSLQQITGSAGILAFESKLVGSANEGTRPFLPDEYDYLLILTELKQCVRIKQDRKDMTTCYFYLNKRGKKKPYLRKYLVNNGHFDLFLFKKDFENTMQCVINSLFDKNTGKFQDTDLYHDWAFLERKNITALHLRWYGEHYKDMPISIDLVPCIEFEDFKPAKPASYYGVDDCKYYAFCKRKNAAETELAFFPVACTEVEQALMKKYSANARRGFMLAKAIRLTSLITQECAAKLTAAVTNIHDCLKTYMLKTCLFVLHFRLDTNEDDILPERWALLIYDQLLEFVIEGELPNFLDFSICDDRASTFRCDHDFLTISQLEVNRAQCCDNRLNILALVTHLHTLLEEYCERKDINMKPVQLKPYVHDMHLLPDEYHQSSEDTQ